MTQSVWGPVQQEMSELLQGHPDDVPAVVDQLTKLQDVLSRVPPLLHENPLCDFNKLYLRITEGVLERLYAGRTSEHAAILAAFEDGDATTATDLMRDHIATARNHILHLLSAE